jgi:small-conductance mechanosensitive channel
MLDTKFIGDKFTGYLNNLIDSIPNLLLSLFIFVIFYTIAEYYKNQIIMGRKNNLVKTEQQTIISNESTFHDYNSDLIYYQLSWIVYYSIIVFGLLVSLVNVGFNVATIVTLLGSVGLAIGLALQQTISNVISGIYISVNKLFKIGDDIALKPLGSLNSTIGKIIDFNLYYTTVANLENNTVQMIPNSIIQNNILTNITISRNIFN